MNQPGRPRAVTTPSTSAATGTANYALELPASSPDAHTAFRRTFKKLTHFALETLACDSFTVTSGSYTNVDIPRVGDVVYALYIQLALPGLANVIQPTVASSNAPTTGQYYEVVHDAAQKTAINAKLRRPQYSGMDRDFYRRFYFFHNDILFEQHV